jgi:GH25 family lysozyme M1 (1,4-beta-N-acetylmuramidase)
VSWTPGIDVSRYQGEINWQTVAAAGCRFAIIRATVGNHYTDPRFYVNWQGAKNSGLLVSAYHVVKPSHTAESQIERLVDALGDRAPDLPLVLDVELADDQPKNTITAVTLDSAKLLAERTGRKPIIYTGGWFWNPNINRLAEWNEYDLWIAHYGVSSPTLPLDWTAWRFWQHSESGSVAGVQSRHTDLNWFQGTVDDLLAYAQVGAVPPPSDVPGRDEAMIATELVITGSAPSAPAGTTPVTGAAQPVTVKKVRARVTSPFLHMRNGPGVNYTQIGELHEGDTRDLLDLGGKEVWVAIGPGQWVAFIYNGERYMTLVED